MGEARGRGQWIARELLIKFGPNPSRVSPQEAENYLYNLCQALGKRPFPQGFVSRIWEGLRKQINVELIGGG